MLHETDLSRVDLNLLVLFETVMGARHVGRAAERLNLSASAVSHALGRLRTLLDDPLFLRTPRGVVPTERAERLAPLIEDILARVRSVVATAEPFNPRRSTRRFRIGAPDGISSTLLPRLLHGIGEDAPGVDLSVCQLLPKHGELAPDAVWAGALADLDARILDVAILPTSDVPKRFAAHGLYQEDFVLAMRAGHTYASAPGLSEYCAMRHVVVSDAGDPIGNVDVALAGRGLSRRVALTVPNFMLALALLADTDLLCALPRRLVAQQGARFGIVAAELPLELPHYRISAVMPDVAARDHALPWLIGALRRSFETDDAPLGGKE